MTDISYTIPDYLEGPRAARLEAIDVLLIAFLEALKAKEEPQ